MAVPALEWDFDGVWIGDEDFGGFGRPFKNEYGGRGLGVSSLTHLGVMEA